MTEFVERPNKWPWPPMLYAGFIIIAMLLGSYLPWPLLGDAQTSPWPFRVGSALFMIGFALDISTLLFFVRRKANFLPHKAATQLITSGPFRLSRNPIYLGNTLALLGAGVAFNSAWLVLAALAAAVFVHFLAILREERHLSARFGKQWDDYASRTPRWLLF